MSESAAEWWGIEKRASESAAEWLGMEEWVQMSRSVAEWQGLSRGQPEPSLTSSEVEFLLVLSWVAKLRTKLRLEYLCFTYFKAIVDCSAETISATA